MTATRRTFIQYAGFSLASLALPRVPPWLEGRQYAEFPQVGLGLTIPASWRFVAGPEIEQRRADVVLPGGDAAKERVIEMAGYPFIVAAREQSASPGPMVVIWRQDADELDLAADDNEEFAGVHDLTYRNYASYFRDYRLVGEGAPVKFAGKPASRVVVEFCEDIVSGESWDVHLASRMLRWGASWLTFNFLQPAGPFAKVSADFAAIEAGIRLFPAEAAV